MEHSSNTIKVVGALLIGAVIGGALGVLFAPDKGCETRRKLSAKGHDFTDSMKDKFNDFVDEIKNEIEEAKEKATDFMEKHGMENA